MPENVDSKNFVSFGDRISLVTLGVEEGGFLHLADSTPVDEESWREQK